LSVRVHAAVAPIATIAASASFADRIIVTPFSSLEARGSRQHAGRR
jgi:hypothetical protein